MNQHALLHDVHEQARDVGLGARELAVERAADVAQAEGREHVADKRAAREGVEVGGGVALRDLRLLRGRERRLLLRGKLLGGRHGSGGRWGGPVRYRAGF